MKGYVLHHGKDEGFSLIYRGLGIFWAMPVLILSNVYEAVLFSILAVPRYEYIIGNINELANRTDIDVYVWKGSNIDEFLMVSTGPYFLFLLPTGSYDYRAQTLLAETV